MQTRSVTYLGCGSRDTVVAESLRLETDVFACIKNSPRVRAAYTKKGKKKRVVLREEMPSVPLEMDPLKLWPTQKSISQLFTCGRRVVDTYNELKELCLCLVNLVFAS